MAGPFLATLGRSAALFYPAARAGVSQGRSLSATLKLYRDAGNSISNAAARSMFRALQAHETAATVVRSLPRNRRIPSAALPEALTKIRRALSFTVEVRGFLSSTGDEVVRHITISSNREMTPAHIEALAEETMETSADRYGIEVEEVHLIRGERSGPAGRF
jgi:hypothetical protein